MTRIRRAVEELSYIACNVSLPVAFLQFACLVDSLIAGFRGSGFSQKVHSAKNGAVQKFLRTEFSGVINEWSEESVVEDLCAYDASVAPIWICWLQGEENAPMRVRSLIARVRSLAGGHPVNVVDREEIESLVDLPEAVLDGLESGRLRPQTFADVARVWLLAKYGGIWLDASILLVKPIPERVFEEDMWTAKGIELCFPSAPGLVDIALWQSYFIGSRRSGVTVSFMYDFMTEYFSRYSGMIDYLLINHVAKIARDCVPAIAVLFDEVPQNNELCESLCQYMLNEGIASEETRRLYLEGDTFFYKLSWRADYSSVTSDGLPTFAGTYLRGLL